MFLTSETREPVVPTGLYPMGSLVTWLGQSRRTELFSSVIILRL
jgi:hypothetical protein